MSIKIKLGKKEEKTEQVLQPEVIPKPPKLAPETEFRFMCQSIKLKKVAEALKTLTAEVIIKIDKNEVRTRVIDPGQVAMLSLELPKDYFKIENKEVVYDCSKLVEVSVRPEQLLTLLLSTEDTQSIEVTKKVNDPKIFLNVIEEQTTVHGTEYITRDHWGLPQVEAGLNPWTHPLPKVEAIVEAKIKIESLVKRLKVYGQLGISDVRLTFDKDKLIFDAYSDFGSGENTYTPNDGKTEYVNLNGEKFTNTYELRYLVDLTESGGKFAEWVIISTNKDEPLYLNYLMEKGQLQQWQAPRAVV